jgi:hypothetical protein
LPPDRIVAQFNCSSFAVPDRILQLRRGVNWPKDKASEQRQKKIKTLEHFFRLSSEGNPTKAAFTDNINNRS